MYWLFNSAWSETQFKKGRFAMKYFAENRLRQRSFNTLGCCLIFLFLLWVLSCCFLFLMIKYRLLFFSCQNREILNEVHRCVCLSVCACVRMCVYVCLCKLKEWSMSVTITFRAFLRILERGLVIGIAKKSENVVFIF